ncbi:MAG: isopeptide-forming domain-containing fimbrial protein [Anaerotignum sp.]
MKGMKKLVSLVLALAMVLAMAVPSFAAGFRPAKTTTVYFNSGISLFANGQSASQYDGYKLLNLTTSLKCAEDHTHKSTCYNYAYTINDTYADIMVDAANAVLGGNSVTEDNLIKAIQDMEEDTTLLKFANEVYKAIQAEDLPADEAGIENSADIDQGYWMFVDTTNYESTDYTRSLLILDTHGQEELVVTPKQDLPVVDKEVEDVDYNIGDTVEFTLRGTVDKYLEYYDSYTYIFHDTISDGLDLDTDSFVVYLDDVELDPSEYTINYACDCGCSFAVEINDLQGLDDVTENSIIKVEYTATLNEDAVIGDPGNPNDVYLEYSNNPYNESSTGKTEKDVVVVFTYELDVTKVDKNDADVTLEGAEFVLYRKNGGTKEYVQLDSDDKVNGWGNKDDATTLTSDEDGFFKIIGLDSGIYYLEETKAPDGYNLLKDPIELVITAKYLDDGTENKGIVTNDLIELDELTATADGDDVTTRNGKVVMDVENGSGVELPSTGGIGTRIFYAAGGILVVGAVVLLVTKKRMKMED